QREQRLDRPAAPLLGPHAHRERRREEEEEPRQVEEQRAQRRLALLEEVADLEEEEAPDHREDEEDHVGDGGLEEGPELLPGDDQGVTHGYCSPPRVSCAKTSSSDSRRAVSSLRTSPFWTAYSKMRSPPPSSRVATWKRAAPPPAGSASTPETNGAACSADFAFAASPFTPTVKTPPPAFAASSDAAEPSATILPNAMMIMRPQVASTSGRMWVERMIVFFSAMRLMRPRISTI